MSTRIRKPATKSGLTFIDAQNAMKSEKWKAIISLLSESKGGKQPFLDRIKLNSIRDLQSNNNTLADALNALYGVNADQNTCRRFSASPAGRKIANDLIAKLSGGINELSDAETIHHVKTAFNTWLESS